MASVSRITRPEKGTVYRARVRVPGGKVLTRTFPTEKEATAWATLLEADKLRGALPEDLAAGRKTFGEWAAEWMATRDLRATTRTGYEGLLRRSLLPTFENVALRKITPEAVRRWHKAALDKAKRNGTGYLIPPKAYRLLSAILATAVTDGVIARNPCTIRGAGEEPKKERDFYDLEKLHDLADELGRSAPHLRALVITAGLGALRRGELLGLERRDVDLLHGTIRVERQVTRSTGTERVVTMPKTDAGTRTVHMDAVLAAELAEHLERFTGPEPDAAVFVGDRGGPLAFSTLYKHLGAARTALGWPDTFHLHDLRHLAGTTYAELGATTKELMAHGGWATPAAAMRYQHAAQRRAAELAERMGERVTAAREDRAGAPSRNVVDLDRARTAREAVGGGVPPEAGNAGNPCSTRDPRSGADGNRTHDPLLAKDPEGSPGTTDANE